MPIQRKAIEQYFPVVLFIMLYKVVLTSESVDGICSANAETTGSNPVEAPKSFFSGFFAIA